MDRSTSKRIHYSKSKVSMTILPIDKPGISYYSVKIAEYVVYLRALLLSTISGDAEMETLRQPIKSPVFIVLRAQWTQAKRRRS